MTKYYLSSKYRWNIFRNEHKEKGIKVVLAQLADQLLTTSEDQISNPVIFLFIMQTFKKKKNSNHKNDKKLLLNLLMKNWNYWV